MPTIDPCTLFHFDLDAVHNDCYCVDYDDDDDVVRLNVLKVCHSMDVYRLQYWSVYVVR